MSEAATPLQVALARVYELEQELFKAGKTLTDDEHDERELWDFGRSLIWASGLCVECKGEGCEHDEDGGTFACSRCNGSGRNIPAVTPPTGT